MINVKTYGVMEPKEIRPRLKIEAEPIDRVIDTIGLIGLFTLISLPIYFFNAYEPETLGAFNSSRHELIWLLPITGTLLFIAFQYFKQHPHTFTFTSDINYENALRHYTNAAKVLRIINSASMCIMAYITYTNVQAGLGVNSDLGQFFILGFILATWSICSFCLYKSFR